MKCNYDTWKTEPPKNLNQAHTSVLRGMQDGKERTRCDMIRQGRPPTDPNPRSEFGNAGWNKLDYNLYKMGFLICTRESGGQKYFRISAKGLRLVKSIKGQRAPIKL